MNRLRRRVVLRLLAGVLLLTLAAGVAMVIKDALALREPENSIPEMTVWYNGERLSTDHQMMDSYEWRFTFTTRSWFEPNREAFRTDAALPAAPVLPGAPMEIEFSYPYQELKISRALGDGAFGEVAGNLTTPSEPGTYIYKVEPNWGVRGSALFYFKITVV